MKYYSTKNKKGMKYSHIITWINHEDIMLTEIVAKGHILYGSI